MGVNVMLMMWQIISTIIHTCNYAKCLTMSLHLESALATCRCRIDFGCDPKIIPAALFIYDHLYSSLIAWQYPVLSEVGSAFACSLQVFSPYIPVATVTFSMMETALTSALQTQQGASAMTTSGSAPTPGGCVTMRAMECDSHRLIV